MISYLSHDLFKVIDLYTIVRIIITSLIP